MAEETEKEEIIKRMYGERACLEMPQTPDTNNNHIRKQ